jgi:hypothetical protein
MLLPSLPCALRRLVQVLYPLCFSVRKGGKFLVPSAFRQPPVFLPEKFVQEFDLVSRHMGGFLDAPRGIEAVWEAATHDLSADSMMFRSTSWT